MTAAEPTVYRQHRRSNFTTLPNDMLNDPAVSWKAKGILAYLISKPTTWKARLVDIEAHGTEGQFAVASALRELCGAGYMRRVRERQPDGRWTTITEYADYSRWDTNDGEPEHEPHAETASGTTRGNRGSPHAETASGPHAETAPLSKTEQVTNTKNKKEVPRALSAAQLEKWAPDEQLAAWTKETNPQLTASDVQQWRDYHTAKGTKIKDPAASWRTWVRNSLRYGAVNEARRPQTEGSMVDRVRQYLGTETPTVTASYVPGKLIDVEVAR